MEHGHGHNSHSSGGHSGGGGLDLDFGITWMVTSLLEVVSGAAPIKEALNWGGGGGGGGAHH